MSNANNLNDAGRSNSIGTLAHPANRMRLAPGENRGEPLPLNTQATAGPLQLVVTQTLVGAEATQQVLAASSRNEQNAEGLTYAIANMTVVNTGSKPVMVDNDDFGFTSSAGRLRRAVEIDPPAPALSETLNSGEQVQGWVAGIVEDGDPNIVLIFNSRVLGGSWAERHFALQEGAVIADPGQEAMAINEVGREASAPAQVGETVATQDWVVTFREVEFADDVFNLYPASDYRTTALGSAVPDLIQFWVGVGVDIQSNHASGAAQHFPVTAFGLAYGDGSPVPDVRLLSSPLPDVSGLYFPGGGGSGWITFEVPPDYDGSLVRFQPFRTDDDARFLTWGDGAAPTAPVSEFEPTREPTGAVLETGTEVIVLDSDVNMRDGPTVNGTVVETLALDTVLVVIGGPEEADGYVWYQVQDPATGASGFVASNFLAVNE